jgi:hypothetical protein
MKLRGFVTRRPYWRRFDDADVTVTFDIGFSDQFYIFDAVLSEMLSEMAHEFVLRYLLFLHISSHHATFAHQQPRSATVDV